MYHGGVEYLENLRESLAVNNLFMINDIKATSLLHTLRRNFLKCK